MKIHIECTIDTIHIKCMSCFDLICLFEESSTLLCLRYFCLFALCTIELLIKAQSYINTTNRFNIQIWIEKRYRTNCCDKLTKLLLVYILTLDHFRRSECIKPKEPIINIVAHFQHRVTTKRSFYTTHIHFNFPIICDYWEEGIRIIQLLHMNMNRINIDCIFIILAHCRPIIETSNQSLLLCTW